MVLVCGAYVRVKGEAFATSAAWKPMEELGRLLETACALLSANM
jgi:hypothetical protein